MRKTGRGIHTDNTAPQIEVTNNTYDLILHLDPNGKFYDSKINKWLGAGGIIADIN